MAVFAIDFGGVIVAPATEGSRDSVFFDFDSFDFLEVPPRPGAKEVLEQFVLAGHDVHLVSKAGERIEARIRQWLEQHDFVRYVFGYANLHFCQKRADKAVICHSIKADCMIDDREDVLDSCAAFVKTTILFGAARHEAHLACIDWPAVGRAVANLK